MPLAAFDSQTCIWGIKRQSGPGQANMIGLADQLIKLLTKHRVDILLPSTVVSELLSDLPKPQALSFFNDVSKRFRISYFDPKATIVLGEILNHHYSNKKYQTLGITKTVMKYDAYIIAGAIAAGAECIYSEDPDFPKIAAHFIPILSLGQLPPSIKQAGGPLLVP